MRVCYLGDITSQSGGLKASPALWRIWPYMMKVPVLALWCVGMWNSEGSEAIHLPLCLSQCFNHEGHWIHDFWMLWWRLACRCENKRQGKLHRGAEGGKNGFSILRACEMLERAEVSAFWSLGRWNTLSRTRDEEPQKSVVNLEVYERLGREGKKCKSH